MPDILINGNILTYNKIIYVETTGNDLTGDGSISLPYATIGKAVSGSVIANGNAVKVGIGVFRLYSIDTLIANTDKQYDLIGEGLNTIIEIEYAPANLSRTNNSKVRVFRSTFRAINGIGGSMYQLAGYWSNASVINMDFYNCLFTLSLDGLRPATQSGFVLYFGFGGNSGADGVDKKFNSYNCSYIGRTGASTYPMALGIAKGYNLASDKALYSVNNVVLTGSEPNVTFDSDYIITSDGRVDTAGVYSGIYKWSTFLPTKYLLKDTSNNNIYTIVNGAPSLVTNGDPTENHFQVSGKNDLVDFKDILFNQLPGNTLKILEFNARSTVRNIVLNYTPKPQVIKATGDINLESVLSINSITLTATQGGTSVLRIVASNDSGISWYNWNNATPLLVDTNNLTDFKNNGMTIAQLNSLTSTKILTMLAGGKKLRFAYYYELVGISDILQTDQLSINVQMEGQWDKAKHKVDYTYNYENDTTLKIRLFSNGEFKINY